MTHKAYVHQINDIYKKMAENDREIEVLTVKNEDARTSEAMQATKVSAFIVLYHFRLCLKKNSGQDSVYFYGVVPTLSGIVH